MTALRKYKKFIEYLQSNNEIDFFDALNDYILRHKAEEADILLAKIAENYDVLNIAIIALQKNFDCFTLLHILPNINLATRVTVPDILEFLKDIYHKTLSDGLHFKVYEVFRNILKCNKNLCLPIKTNLQKSNENYASHYLAEVYLLQAETYPLDVHAELLSLIEAENDDNTLSGYIGALASINYSSLDKAILDLTLAGFDKISSNGSIKTITNIIWAYGKMLRYSTKIHDKLVKLSISNIFEVKNMLAQVLFANTQYNTQAWYNEILFSLCDIPSNKKEVFEFIDYILEQKLHKKEFYLVTDFLEKWALYNSDCNKYKELFSSTFYELLNYPQDLSKLLVKYFSSNTFSVVVLGCEICKFYHLHLKKGLYLDAEKLKLQDEKTIIYMLKMIHGCLFEFNVIAPLTISILDRFIDNEKLLMETIELIFLNLIGYNYPSKTLEYLNDILTSEDFLPKINYINFIKQHIQERIERLEDINKINEICIGQKLLKEVHFAREMQLNKEIEKAQTSSIIAAITHKVPIKYGHSTIYSVNNKQHSHITNMTAFEVNFELPISEMTKPIDDAILRYSFRKTTREDDETCY